MNRKTKTKSILPRIAGLLSLALVLTCPLPAKADDTTIVIKQKSGGETTLELSQNPEIKVSGADMVVTSKLTTITIPLDDVDYYTFSNVASTSIAPVVNAPQLANGRVVFQGLPQGIEVCVYSLKGRLVSKQSADNNGRVDFCLDQFPKGAYVISAGGKKIKVMNK